MSLPSDLELTKLRLWFHRAESRQHELEEDAYQARRDFEELWLRYVDRCKKLGFCAACEKPLPECRCVLVGAYLNEKLHAAAEPDGDAECPRCGKDGHAETMAIYVCDHCDRWWARKDAAAELLRRSLRITDEVGNAPFDRSSAR